MKHFSIKFRLSLAFYLFLGLVICLGLFNIACLTNFNEVASQIRTRWLPNTRFLGDINNYTSDFRSAEGTLLLGSDSRDVSTTEKEIVNLDKLIALGQRGFEGVYHDNNEAELYGKFLASWNAYRKGVDKIMALARAGDRNEAIKLYKTTSRSAYNAASDTLGELTSLNVAEDQEASDHAAAIYGRVRFLSVFVIIVATLMLIIGVIYISRFISTPILEFAKNMRRLADNDMNIDIEGLKRRDEIGEMARALAVFRGNAVELLLSRQGLVQQASMLEERLKHERSLMDAQRNFISMASHEFRTPLNIIDAHAQRLVKLKDPIKTADIVERTGRIRVAVRQMTQLIDNLINAARLFDSNPNLYFHPADFDLNVLLRKVCDQYRELTAPSQITETFVSSPLTMFGDLKLLEQLFSNLLSNAIKYSAPGGLIRIETHLKDGSVAVLVQDEGIGIPVQDLEAIFERYVRGSNIADVSGTGIGLYLARMVVKLHFGTIEVESVEGEGSRFTVRLPLSPYS